MVTATYGNPTTNLKAKRKRVPRNGRTARRQFYSMRSLHQSEKAKMGDSLRTAQAMRALTIMVHLTFFHVSQHPRHRTVRQKMKTCFF